MKKIAMSKVTKESLVDVVLGQSEVVIPNSVTVLNYQTGEFDRGEKGLMYWANLSVVDVEELELLKSVGLEENASLIKLKVSDYNNENLEALKGKVLDTNAMEIVFVEKKSKVGSEITGLAFKTSFRELSLLSGVVIKPVLPIDYSYYETHRTYWRYVEYDFMRAVIIAGLFLVFYIVVEISKYLFDKKKEVKHEI